MQHTVGTNGVKIGDRVRIHTEKLKCHYLFAKGVTLEDFKGIRQVVNVDADGTAYVDADDCYPLWDIDYAIIVSPRQSPLSVIANTGGRVFGAVVTKRNGKERTFNAKITKDSFSIEALKMNCVLVQDINATRKAGDTEYRMIALEGVQSITDQGKTYTF